MNIWENITINGELQQGLQIDVAGHDLQIVRYDGDNEQFLVKMDDHIDMMAGRDVFEYVMDRL